MHSMKIAPSTHIQPSATVHMNSLALEKKRAGQRVYNLSAGEPMVETAKIVIEAAYRAMKEGKTHYPPVAGIPELREEAAAWMNRMYGATYTPKETVVTCGGKHGLAMTLSTLLCPGDEVLIMAPYWVSYPTMVQIAGGVPKIIATKPENEWKVDPNDLVRTCTARTRFIILNNAANPTGVIYTKEEINTLLRIAHERGITVISDEVYSGLVYDGQPFVSCASFPEYHDHVVVIQSCSKHFAMTGWRVGFVFGPEDLISVLVNVQSQTTTGTSSISQWAALTALQHGEEIMNTVNHTMQTRRDMFLETFQREFGVPLARPRSALYCLFPMQALGIPDTDSAAFCYRVLDEANVALVPGAPFGEEGYVRASFGAHEDEIAIALCALAQYLHT